MAKDETDNIARVVAEMSASTKARTDHDWKKAQKAARDQRIDDDAEIAKRSAIAVLDEKDARDRRWYATHLGRLSASQYRDYCQKEYGFDPGV
jgi:hypothetical protein